MAYPESGLEFRTPGNTSKFTPYRPRGSMKMTYAHIATQTILLWLLKRLFCVVGDHKNNHTSNKSFHTWLLAGRFFLLFKNVSVLILFFQFSTQCKVLFPFALQLSIHIYLLQSSNMEILHLSRIAKCWKSWKPWSLVKMSPKTTVF